MKGLVFKLTSFTFYLLVILTLGCKKSSTSSNAQNSNSNWTISNSTISSDNDNYSSHPTGCQNASHSDWNSIYNYFSLNGWNNNCQKMSYVNVHFASKPTSTANYTTIYHNPNIGVPTTIGASECYLQISNTTPTSGATNYQASPGQTIIVTVNNGIVSLNLSNISLIGTNISAMISGVITEGL